MLVAIPSTCMTAPTCNIASARSSRGVRVSTSSPISIFTVPSVSTVLLMQRAVEQRNVHLVDADAVQSLYGRQATFDEALYQKLRSTLLGCATVLPGAAGRHALVSGYRFVRRMIRF